MKDALREPLLHFLLLGGLVFGLETALAPEEADPHVIVVDHGVQVEVERQLAESLGRVPSDDELEAGIERWIAVEVLAREARELGLDRDDALVRERLAERLVFVAEAVEVPPTPSEAELLELLGAERMDPAELDAIRPGLERQWQARWLEQAAERAAEVRMDRYEVRR